MEPKEEEQENTGGPSPEPPVLWNQVNLWVHTGSEPADRSSQPIEPALLPEFYEPQLLQLPTPPSSICSHEYMYTKSSSLPASGPA